MPMITILRGALRSTALLFLLVSSSAVAAGAQVMMFKSPHCGCCVKWAEHMESAGFQVESRDVENMSEVKARFGIPPQAASCHTAIVDGRHIVEGHVPAGLVQRMLEDDDVMGLAVPGMPPGSPGMESPNPVVFDVIAIDASGRASIFERVQGQAPGQ